MDRHFVVAVFCLALGSCGQVPGLPTSEPPSCRVVFPSYPLIGCAAQDVDARTDIATEYVRSKVQAGALVDLELHAVNCIPVGWTSGSDRCGHVPWFCNATMCSGQPTVCGEVGMMVEDGAVSDSEINTCEPATPCRVIVTRERVTRLVSRSKRATKNLDFALDFRTLEGQSSVLWCVDDLDSGARTLVDARSGEMIGRGEPSDASTLGPRYVVD